DATLVVDVGELDRQGATATAAAVHQLIRSHGGAAVVASPVALPLPVPHHEAPMPAFGERRALWAGAAGDRGLAFDEPTLDRLASNHRLTRAQIDRVFAASAGSAPSALSAAAHRLGGVTIRHARAVPLGRTFDDLV